MKLLILVTQGEQGGAQKNVSDLATSLFGESGFDIHVATGREQNEKDSWLKKNLIKSGFKASHIHEIKNLVREVKIFTKDIAAFFELFFFIRKNKFDCVHLHSVKAGMLGACAGKLAGAKVVYTVHGFVMKEPMGVLKKVFYSASELLGSLCIDQYICVSEQDLQIGKKYKVIRGKKGEVIYNGVDIQTNNLLDKDSAQAFIQKKVPSLGAHSNHVVTIANLYKTKSLETLIQAAYILEHTYDCIPTFVIIGEGSERENLELLIKELDITNVFLIGSVEDASKYLKAFDLFVLSSVKEGFPYAPIEAAAAGLPIVATKVGGISEMAKYIPMSLVVPKDDKALAKAIFSRLCQEREKRTKPNLDKFTLSHMIARTKNVYKKVYDKHN